MGDANAHYTSCLDVTAGTRDTTIALAVHANRAAARLKLENFAGAEEAGLYTSPLFSSRPEIPALWNFVIETTQLIPQPNSSHHPTYPTTTHPSKGAYVELKSGDSCEALRLGRRCGFSH